MTLHREFEASCDWCGKPLMQANESIACKECHEKLEQENAELAAEVATLKAHIEELTCGS